MEDLRERNEPTAILSLLSNWLSLPVAPPPLGAGSVLAGRYTLRKQIGEGGMGSVWRATQKMIEREVAVKMIHPALATPALCGKFAGEMEILGKLEHPGIVRIFDAGIHEREDGVAIPFFAMELVEGVALHRWAPAHRHDRGMLLGVMAEICAALQHAHDRKIVHRDLKPPNILVRENCHPVVLDFGIARLAGGGTDDAAGAFAGTPHYAAPEQHLGRDRDFRSGESVDVYAAGAILFEIFTGRRLFDFPRNASILEMRRSIIEDTPPRLIDLLPDCPPLIDEIAARAVRRDPVDRYYSMAALARALERAATIESSPPDTELRRWMPAMGEIVPGTEWKLTEKLGEGGAGEVWSGANEKLGERRVFKFCDTEEKARTLKRELTLFRLLKERVGRNPHFIQLHEVSLEEAPWYLMMDFVEARNLEEWCESYPGGLEALPLGTRIEIVAQVAEALQAAHEAGILHRDVKPANLLIAAAEASPRPGEQETAKPHVFISDFGIGQIIASELLRGGTRSGFTLTVSDLRRSTLSGTMLYLAPEVLEGNGATARSDIYSLGVIFWQLLIGNLNAALDPGDWPTRISDPLLRGMTSAVVSRAIPAKRWLSAGDFAASLRALPERQAAEVRRRAEIAAREKAAYRRGVARAAAVAAVVLLVIVATGLYAYKQSADAAVSKANARANSLSASISQLGKVSLGHEVNRTKAATKIALQTRPTTDSDRRAVADAYVPVLEEDEWQFSDGFRYGSVAGGASDVTGRFALLQRPNGAIEFLDLTRKDPVWALRDPLQVPAVVAVAPSGANAAVAADKQLLILDGKSGSIVRVVQLETRATALAWRPDARELAVGRALDDSVGVVDLYQAPDWSSKAKLCRADSFPFSPIPKGLAYSPDGSLLAHWGHDTLHLFVWRVPARKLAGFAYHRAVVLDVTWSGQPRNGESTVCTAAADSFIYTWGIPAESAEATAFDTPAMKLPVHGMDERGHHCSWRSLALLAENEFLAASDETGAVSCFNLRTGEAMAEGQSGAPEIILGGAANRGFLLRDDGKSETMQYVRSPVAHVVGSRQLGPIGDFDILADGSICTCAGAGGVTVFMRGSEFMPQTADETGKLTDGPGAFCLGTRFLDQEHLICSDRGGDRILTIQKEVMESPNARPSLSPSDDRYENRPAYIALDADEKHLVLARSEEIAWKSVSGESSILLPCAFDAAPVSVAISPDGAHFGWVDKLGEARFCEAATKRVRQWPVKNAARIAFLGTEWCVVDGEGDSRFFHVRTGTEANIIGLHPLKVAEFSRQAKGSLAAAAIRGGGIALGVISRRWTRCAGGPSSGWVLR